MGDNSKENETDKKSGKVSDKDKMSEAEDAMQKAILARIAAHASTAAKVTEMATKMPTSQLKAVIGGDAKSGGDKKKMKIGDMDEKELIASTLEKPKPAEVKKP